MKTNAQLPPPEVERLRALHQETNRDNLRSRVLALRNANWPLRAIGDPLGVSRMGVRSWQVAAQESEELTQRADAEQDVPALPITARGSNLRVVRVSPQVPAEDAERLRTLSSQVRKLRAGTSPDSPVQAAVVEYDALIDKYVNYRGVTAMDVARAAGVTRRTIAVHLERINATTSTEQLAS